MSHLGNGLSLAGLVGVLDELDGRAEVLAALHATAFKLKLQKCGETNLKFSHQGHY